MYAFFQACHSFREWLPKDRFAPDRVTRFVGANVELRLCSDIANLTKHRELTRKPATAAEPSIAREYRGAGRGWFGGDGALIVLSDVSDQPYDLRELAFRCLKLWEHFLGISGRDLGSTVGAPT